MQRTNTLLLGIGNTLLSDEGAGIHALNHIRRHLGEHRDLVFIDGGTLSFTLAHYIEDCDSLIVLDAAELHAPPGTVRTVEGTAMDAFLGRAKRSPHEVGLLDLMDIARITDSLPANRALIGIQPDSMQWGMEPTPAVSRALDECYTRTLECLHKWGVIDSHQVSQHRLHGNVRSTQSNEAYDVRS